MNINFKRVAQAKAWLIVLLIFWMMIPNLSLMNPSAKIKKREFKRNLESQIIVESPSIQRHLLSNSLAKNPLSCRVLRLQENLANNIRMEVIVTWHKMHNWWLH